MLLELVTADHGALAWVKCRSRYVLKHLSHMDFQHHDSASLLKKDFWRESLRLLPLPSF